MHEYSDEYITSLTRRGGVPRKLRTHSSGEAGEECWLKEYRASLAILPLTLAAVLLLVGCGGYWYVGHGPGNLHQMVLVVCVIGAVPFALYSVYIAGIVTTLRYNVIEQQASVIVSWYGTERSNTSILNHNMELAIRCVKFCPGSRPLPREMWAGLITFGVNEFLVVVVDWQLESVREYMDSLGAVLGKPVIRRDGVLIARRL